MDSAAGDAIDKAAELAHLSSYQAVEYPALAGWMEQLLDMAGGNKEHISTNSCVWHWVISTSHSS